MVDAARFAEAVNDPDLRPELAGTQYSVVPVAAPGAFHPKLVLQVGERTGRMWLGSHNLTEAGLNHNREVTTVVGTRSDDQGRRLVRQGWRAVRGWLPSGPIGEEAADAFERLAPWLDEVDEGGPMQLPTVLSSTPAEPLWPRLRLLLPPEVRRITVVGPFFDNRLAFLKALRDELAPAEIRVGLQRESATFPADRRHDLPTGVKMVSASGLLDTTRPAAYLHAKALMFEWDDRTVLVTGSANPSAPAFLGGDGANCEAVVVQELEGSNDPLDLRLLREAALLTEADWEWFPPSIPYEPGPPSILVRLGTADHGEIVLETTMDGITEVRFIGDSDRLLRTQLHDGVLSRISVPDGVPMEAVRWLELWGDDALAARVLVHHRRVLRRLCRTGAEQRMIEVLQSMETNHPDLANLIMLLDPLLDEQVQTRMVSSGGSRYLGGSKRRSALAGSTSQLRLMQMARTCTPRRVGSPR
ncbi:MAG: hypothetical protein ABMB14_13255 [Myxococcota bacterium]